MKAKARARERGKQWVHACMDEGGGQRLDRVRVDCRQWANGPGTVDRCVFED